MDGTNFQMRGGRSIEKLNVLVVIGVTANGCKQVLDLQAGDKESSTSWREFFKELKKRGLNKNDIKLGIMDGRPRLEKVFIEEFPSSKIQRCQVHAQRNILAKVPQKNKWYKVIPSALKCLEASLEQTLCYYDFPKLFV